MTTSTTDPAVSPPAEPSRSAPHGLVRATAAIATVGVVVALVGLALLLRPVSTPTQDCGTALGFLLDGRVNEMVSVTDPPDGITQAAAAANQARPCRTRVVDQAAPALVLFGAGLVAAVGAALVEITVRSIGWYRRRAEGRAAADPVCGTPGR